MLKLMGFVISIGLTLLLLTSCSDNQAAEEPTASVVQEGDGAGQVVASSESAVEQFATLPPPIVVEATHTPEPATPTDEASATPEATSTPEETDVPPTDTPAPVPPTNVPQVVQPTSAPPATDTPVPPPPPPQKGANGLVASYFALQDRSDYSAGGRVWFEFEIANSTGGEVSYNALGVMPRKDGVDRFEWYQQTYGGQNSTINPGGLIWEDNIKLPEAGSYTLRLVMCFDGFDNCLQGGGTWHTMSDEIGVQIN